MMPISFKFKQVTLERINKLRDTIKPRPSRSATIEMLVEEALEAREQ